MTRAHLVSDGSRSESRFKSVRPGQIQAVLCDKVQHHFSADRRGTEHAREKPQIREAVFPRKPVAAVSLNRLVECLQRGLGGREFGDVRGLTSGFSGIRELRRPGGHQSAQLHVDIGFSERVRDTLVSADGRGPHAAFPCVAHGLVQGVPADAVADRRSRDKTVS